MKLRQTDRETDLEIEGDRQTERQTGKQTGSCPVLAVDIFNTMHHLLLYITMMEAIYNKLTNKCKTGCFPYVTTNNCRS